MEYNKLIEISAQAISVAKNIIVRAGAGMGVDSGLPDFRGDDGFWKAYPVYEEIGVNLLDIADPIWFEKDPEMAWGFYGHRFNLYKNTEPHEGFTLIKNWVDGKRHFVFTSNVDGHFQRAGFDPDKICEIHGSINYTQCTCCNDKIRPFDEELIIDEDTMLLSSDIPTCLKCGGILRPNIFMFGDREFNPSRVAEQKKRYSEFMSGTNLKETVQIEIGAGTYIPTVRMGSHGLAMHGAVLIRINPSEPEGPHINIAEGGLKALSDINKLMLNL